MAKDKPKAVEAEAAETANMTDVRSALEQGLRMFKAFKYANEALAVVDGLEQVTRERRQSADAILAEVENAQAEEADARIKRDNARSEAKKLIADAKESAAAMVADAEAKATEIAASAKAELDAVKAERESVVAELLEKTQAIEALAPQLEDAKALIARAEKAKAALQEV